MHLADEFCSVPHATLQIILLLGLGSAALLVLRELRVALDAASPSVGLGNVQEPLAPCQSLKSGRGAHWHGLLSLSVHTRSSGPWAARAASCSGTGSPTHGRPVPCSYPVAMCRPISAPPRGCCCCFVGVRLRGVHMALLQATWEVVQPGYTLKTPPPTPTPTPGPRLVLFLWSYNKQTRA